MNRLFIVGNGFDRAHGLPTAYSDFKQYLISICPPSKIDQFAIPDPIMDKDGCNIYNPDDLIPLFLNVISLATAAKDIDDYDTWNDFENALGRLDFRWFLEQFEIQDDDKESHLIYRNEDNAVALTECFSKLSDYFTEWIEQISIDCPQLPNFQKLLADSDNIFLSFNYTNTLETLYSIPNVYHIHGRVNFDNLIFGHAEGEDMFQQEYESKYWGADFALGDLFDALRKPTADIIKSSSFKEWLSMLMTQVPDEIYSFGFSFNNIDEPYIRAMMDCIPTHNTIWKLNTFERAKHPQYQSVIRNCGFKGDFDEYSI